MNIFRGHSANDAWTAAAPAFSSSHARSQTSRLGPTRELSQAAFVIENPRQRWVSSRTPPANIALALAEVIWIVAGRSDSQFLSAWSKSYTRYVSAASHQHDAYGSRLRTHFGLDQLTRAAEVLSSNPDSRQVVLQIWDPRLDLPLPDGSPIDQNVPCNVACMLKVRDGRLEWTQILRSNDFFRGTPYNFVQFTSLQELLAGWIGIIPGTYTHISDSLHVYEHELQLVRAPLHSGVICENTDSLAFGMSDCLHHFLALEQMVDKISVAVREDEILDFGNRSLPVPITNLLTIFIAERFRQLQLHRAAMDAVDRCTNPYLSGAWTTWANHLRRRKQ
jgi:thymidylate synthase